MTKLKELLRKRSKLNENKKKKIQGSKWKRQKTWRAVLKKQKLPFNQNNVILKIKPMN